MPKGWTKPAVLVNVRCLACGEELELYVHNRWTSDCNLSKGAVVGGQVRNNLDQLVMMLATHIDNDCSIPPEKGNDNHGED